jgi:hypothetical protein
MCFESDGFWQKVSPVVVQYKYSYCTVISFESHSYCTVSVCAYTVPYLASSTFTGVYSTMDCFLSSGNITVEATRTKYCTWLPGEQSTTTGIVLLVSTSLSRSTYRYLY